MANHDAGKSHFREKVEFTSSDFAKTPDRFFLLVKLFLAPSPHLAGYSDWHI